jgi:hypothetical protein
MRKITITLSLILFVVTLAACSSTTAVVPEVEEILASEPLLDIIGLDETVSLSMEELKALAADAAIEGGTTNMVMAGMDSNVWVKDVNFLEVK